MFTNSFLPGGAFWSTGGGTGLGKSMAGASSS